MAEVMLRLLMLLEGLLDDCRAWRPDINDKVRTDNARLKQTRWKPNVLSFAHLSIHGRW